MTNTRRYAKRQRTWFRGVGKATWIHVGHDETPEAVATRIFSHWRPAT